MLLRKFLEVNVRIFLFLTCKASEMLSHDDILALPFTARELNHHSRERQAYHVFLSLCYQHIKSGSSSVLSLLHNRDMSSIVQASGTEIVPCNLSLELSDKSFDSTDTPPQSHKMERHSSIIKPNSTELVSALSHKAETPFPFE